MPDRHALNVSDAIQWLDTAERVWRRPIAGEMSDPEEARRVKDERLSFTVEALDKVRAACATLQMSGALAEAERLELTIRIGFKDDVVHGLKHLRERMREELATTFLLHIPASRIEFLNVAEPFGRAVARKFPKAVHDLRSAGNCLAFGEATASVFHLMRGMEVMVQRLAKRIGVTNVEKEWGKLLSDIDRAIEKMPKGSVRNSWSESHSLLYHVKQAWRNETMHPKSAYSTAEASQIYQAVGAFAQALARLI